MNIVSLFSGAGGLDLGLIRAGHEIIWANDFDVDSCETYKKNIGNHVVCKDISLIDFNEIPHSDVIVGGFPCQGFSLANLNRRPEDSRNHLYKYFYQLIKQKQPKYFLAENVRGILSLGNGEVIKQIVKDFDSAGYRVKHEVFNTANYGVPQSRIRVIISGTRKDISSDLNYKFPEKLLDKENWISIGKALSEIPEPDDTHNLTNHICSKYKVTNRNFTGHRTTNPNKPSPTILARGNGKGGVCAIQHPNNHRRMSVRESAIIQTFPMNFEFMGSMSSMYRQVGNAVPVLFASYLGEELSKLENVLT
ncbi:MAG: DNA cytosine methyltransferase [Flavobacteriales bacterium]|nr:DNA cytosine methyltransferase [Flavobacteriales bacterium]